MFTDRTNTAQWIESEKRWKIKVQRDGVRKCFTSSTRGRTGQREANAKADAWLHGELVEHSKRLRVADAIDLYERYLAELEAIRRGETLSPTQKITGRMLGNSRPAISLLRCWLEPYNRKWLDTIGDAEVQTVLDRAAAAGRSKKTIQDLRAAILAMIKHHRRRGATAYRPDDISISPSARLKGKNILQPTAIKKLFESDQTILNRKQCFDDLIYAYRFQVLTGFRPGELIGLKWEDVDLQNGIIHLQRSINVYGNETQGKNENAIRDFTLHKNARNVLIAQRLATGRSTGYVFKIYAEATYRSRFYRYCEVNGIQRVTPYELRHTFISMVQNLPQGDLKALVGHSAKMDTLGTYGHAVDGQNERIAASLDSIFSEMLRVNA